MIAMITLSLYRGKSNVKKQGTLFVAHVFLWKRDPPIPKGAIGLQRAVLSFLLGVFFFGEGTALFQTPLTTMERIVKVGAFVMNRIWVKIQSPYPQ